MLYLDHAATTPMRPEAWEAMQPFAHDVFGNSSGIHEISRQAKNALEEAREQAAELLGAGPREIVFTGGGTEADNLAIKGRALSAGHPKAIVASAIEHEAVLESARFCESFGSPVRLTEVDEMGLVDPLGMCALVDADTALVSLMAANNETGVIEPVAATAEAVKNAQPDVAVHTDAVQTFASEEVDVRALGVDLLTLSAHKFGGPKGAGLLYVREGVQLEPVVHGGGHELGRRSGTHNVMGAVGMAAAMAAATKDRDRFRRDVSEARDRFEKAIAKEVPDLAINAPLEARLVQHSHLRIPGVNNETLLIRLDQLGAAASSASACQSGAAKVSHVLLAMGLDAPAARECVRFTFGWTTLPEDGEAASELVIEAIEGLR